MESKLGEILDELNTLNETEKIEAINKIKIALHEVSPLKNEPVDCVLWVKNEQVEGNEYNPNKVAPPEMVLLGISIEEDGFTQPIVAFPENERFKVVDGFHRNRVGKEIPAITQRLKGYLPITLIRPDREGKSDRIASTIRHNRARGKHTITGMTDIIVELKRRNHSNEWIARELGMDADEILRLSQISGLAEMFADKDFSEAWETDNPMEVEASALDEDEKEMITEQIKQDFTS